MGMIGVGAVVRLKRGVALKKGRREKTTVQGFINEIEGGVVLDDRLEGSRCWNIQDLELVPGENA